MTDSRSWENWYTNTQSSVSDQIWAIVDPEGPEVATTPRPIPPQFSEFRPDAVRFADLNQAERRDFMNAQQIFEFQFKAFEKEEQKLIDLRKKIFGSVSVSKKAQLRKTETTREWLRILMEGTKPTAAEARRDANQRYMNAIVPFRPATKTSANTVFKWVDVWETAMAEGIRIELA